MDEDLERILESGESRGLIARARDFALNHIHVSSALICAGSLAAAYCATHYLGANLTPEGISYICRTAAVGSFALSESYLNIAYFRRCANAPSGKIEKHADNQSSLDRIIDFCLGYNAAKSAALAAASSSYLIGVAERFGAPVSDSRAAIIFLSALALDFAYYYVPLKSSELLLRSRSRQKSAFYCSVLLNWRNKARALDICEDFAKRFDDSRYYIFAADVCIRKKDIEGAMEYYDKASQLKPDSIPLPSLFEQYLCGATLYSFDQSKKKRIDAYVDLALSIFPWNPGKSDCMLRKAAYIDSGMKTQLNALYAYFLDRHAAYNPDQCLLQWRRTAALALADPSTEYEPIGESKNPVRVIKGDFMSSAFVIKSSSYSGSLEAEQELCERLSSLVAGHSIYCAPKPVCLLHGSDISLYIMKRSKGPTLLELLDSRAVSDDTLRGVIDFLALQHALLSLSDKDISLAYNMKSKVCSMHLNLSRSVAKEIVQNYRPVYESLKGCIFACSRDAHPQNWVIGDDGMIVSLDCEPRPNAPLQFDLVSLLEYSSHFSDEKKDALISAYIDSYNLHSSQKIVDRSGFHLSYLNSVIHRSLALCSAWSSPQRKSLHPQRRIVLANALHAIDRIGSDHGEYYSEHYDQYAALKAALCSIISSL